MKNFIEKHPFWFALLFTVIVMQFFGLVVVVIGRTLGFPDIPLRMAAVTVTTIVPLIFIWRIGWWEDAGLVNTTQNVYALSVPFILACSPLMFFGTHTEGPQRATLILVAVFLTGLSEEAVYRGLFMRAFLPHGKLKAVLLSTVLFAAAHSVQSLGGGISSVEENLAQILQAFIFGLMYGAARLRVNNIWPLIILHALWDLFWTISGLTDGVRILSDIPLAFYLVVWGASIITAIYFVRKPVVTTIDGKPVG